MVYKVTTHINIIDTQCSWLPASMNNKPMMDFYLVNEDYQHIYLNIVAILICVSITYSNYGTTSHTNLNTSMGKYMSCFLWLQTGRFFFLRSQPKNPNISLTLDTPWLPSTTPSIFYIIIQNTLPLLVDLELIMCTLS